MPLYPNAQALIRATWRLSKTVSAERRAIGTLTPAQLTAINAERAAEGAHCRPSWEVIFLGVTYIRVEFCRRYKLEDVVDQSHERDGCAVVVVTSPRMTTIQNLVPRADRYGNQIRDKAVLECTRRHPRPELFTVCRRGTTTRPKAEEPPVTTLL